VQIIAGAGMPLNGVDSVGRIRIADSEKPHFRLAGSHCGD